MMVEDTKCKILDVLLEKWKKILLERYKGQESLVEIGLENLKIITENFYNLELNDTHFDSAILMEEEYHQRLSEIIVSDRLLRDGFELSSKDSGPDFKATKNGNTVWFEVVTPNPNDEMNQILKDVKGRLTPNPETIGREAFLSLLKMTSAIKDKSEKIRGYINKKIVQDNEPIIIVVNDSLFFPLDMYMVGLSVELATGVSSFPLAIEAVLGLDRPVYDKTKFATDADAYLSWGTRDNVLKDNKSPVITNCFELEEYKHISGIFVMTAREDYGISCAVYENKKNVGLLVKNLNSKNIIPDNLLKTKVFDSNSLCQLMNDTSHKGLSSLTLHGHYNNMLHYINNTSIF